MKTKMLDEISAKLAQVLKNLRGGAEPTRKRMPLDEFMSYALAQLDKAARDEPAVAKRRLAALKRSVDGVIGQVAKMIAEDTDSEGIKVEVETAFAPTQAAGDTPMDGLTTAEDQSSTETSLSGISPASGGTAFAESLQQVGKALKKLKAELEGETRPPARAAARKTDPEHAGDSADGREAGGDLAGGKDGDGWPMDLNTDGFLKGAAAAETELTWGADPTTVATPKGR